MIKFLYDLIKNKYKRQQRTLKIGNLNKSGKQMPTSICVHVHIHKSTTRPMSCCLQQRWPCNYLHTAPRGHLVWSDYHWRDFWRACGSFGFAHTNLYMSHMNDTCEWMSHVIFDWVASHVWMGHIQLVLGCRTLICNICFPDLPSILIISRSHTHTHNNTCTLSFSLSLSHTHTHKLTHTQTHTHTHTHKHTHTYAHTLTSIHHVARNFMVIHTQTHTYIHTYTHAYIHTFMHTYIQTYIYSYAAGRFVVSYSDGDRETLTLHQIVKHLTTKTCQSLATNKDNKEKQTIIKVCACYSVCSHCVDTHTPSTVRASDGICVRCVLRCMCERCMFILWVLRCARPLCGHIHPGRYEPLIPKP